MAYSNTDFIHALKILNLTSLCSAVLTLFLFSICCRSPSFPVLTPPRYFQIVLSKQSFAEASGWDFVLRFTIPSSPDSDQNSRRRPSMHADRLLPRRLAAMVLLPIYCHRDQPPAHLHPRTKPKAPLGGHVLGYPYRCHTCHEHPTARYEPLLNP